MERIVKHGFLPISIDKRPSGISNFGILSIILFFLAFGIDMREKNKSNITTTLLILGGAFIGTTALGVSVMDSGKGIATILTVCAMGYVIMGSGVLLRAIQRRRVISKIV
jgi:FtsH-binding integral membrane protein